MEAKRCLACLQPVLRVSWLGNYLLPESCSIILSNFGQVSLNDHWIGDLLQFITRAFHWHGQQRSKAEDPPVLCLQRTMWIGLGAALRVGGCFSTPTGVLHVIALQAAPPHQRTTTTKPPRSQAGGSGPAFLGCSQVPEAEQGSSRPHRYLRDAGSGCSEFSWPATGPSWGKGRAPVPDLFRDTCEPAARGRDSQVSIV